MNKIRIRYRDNDPSRYRFVAKLSWECNSAIVCTRNRGNRGALLLHTVAARSERDRLIGVQNVIKEWMALDQAAH